MLDMSLPYADILMKREKDIELVLFPLPEDYRFSYFKAGDEKAWAKIETSVLEFDDGIDALLYFQRDYLPYLSELERRCLFVETAEGEKIATCTAWWDYSGERRDPWLHWFAVHPNHQGKGIGKALASKLLERMTEIEGKRDFYLHTQTWSHRAVKIYEALGYRITEERNLAGYANEDNSNALAILKSVYQKKGSC